ncbi:MAG: hypothetical protein P8188_10000 [Gemmatimonadota bacterium]
MRRIISPLLVLALTAGLAACTGTDPVAPRSDLDAAGVVAAASTNGSACWGQASKVFAQMGEMGVHSSQQPTPRLGLRNLARSLADQGLLADDSMASLGSFVANSLGLSIEACL